MLGISNIISPGKDLFSPRSVEKAVHWYRYGSGNEDGFTLEGGNVDTWHDQIGSNDLSKSGSSNIPFNDGDIDLDTNGGKLALDATFDGNSNAFSIYLVAKLTTESISNEEICNSNTSNFMRLNDADTIRVRIGDTTNNDIDIDTALEVGAWFVLGVEFTGSTINIYQDAKYNTPSGTASDSDTFDGIASFGIRGNQFDGEIREIVLVDAALDDKDRNRLMEYLIKIKNIA